MEASSLQQFVAARCLVGQGHLVPCKDLRTAYNAWHGGHPVWKGFRAAVEALGHRSKNRLYGAPRKQTNCFVGLKLKAEDGAPDVAPATTDAAPAVAAAIGEQEAGENAAPAVEEESMAPVVEEVPDAEEERPVAATNELVIHGSFLGESDAVKLRKTNEVPPRVSVFDLISVVTGTANPRKTWGDLMERLDFAVQFSMHQFSGAGQRCTPVIDARGVVKVLNNLSGQRAADFRDACADIVVRYLEGDESLVQEIRQNRLRMAHTSVLASIPHKLFKKKKDGVVYTVTTPLCDWVKIGMWTGRLETLKARYRTVYGNVIELNTFLSEDSRITSPFEVEGLLYLR